MQLPAMLSGNAGGALSLREFAVTVSKLTNSVISLKVSADVDLALQGLTELMLSVTLPGQQKTYSIACVVRNRSEQDGAFFYGCEYDWSATIDPLGVVEDLLEYTLENSASS